jgi:lipoprotein-anchoring transpeptidase ErfK/SrfK
MFRRRRTPFVLAALALGAAGTACSEQRSSPTAVQRPAASASTASAPPAPAAPGASANPADAGSYQGPWLGAIVLQAPVFSDMEYPGHEHGEGRVVRLGYLRYGEKTPVLPERHVKPNCPEGWYELLAGGFVCGRYATLDLDHPKFKEVKPPDLDGPLPYAYGINLVNGTPLYRHVPSHEQRVQAEPWLFKPRKPKTDDPDNPYALASNTTAGGADAGVTLGQSAGIALGMNAAGAAIGENAGDPTDVPWWERPSPDGGPPQVTLEDLQEDSGDVVRRMVKGFYLSLDHELDAAGAKWWKTVAGQIAPAYRIMPAPPATDFHGVWLGRDAATYVKDGGTGRRIDKLPMAFVIGYYTRKWSLDDARKHATASDKVDHFTAVGLTGENARVGGTTYWETDEGWWIRSQDAARAEQAAPPEGLQPGEKWIDVNLTRQLLVAYEGDKPVYVTLFSSGRDQHETPPGSFRIREKHIAATMDGDADIASDGPYSIEDVPYIQYFNGGYALHGAFWHAGFGRVKSHGCVNLAPWDAKTLFGWTDPQLPQGWHAVVATRDHPGTRVFVHGRAPGTCTDLTQSTDVQCPEHYPK